MEKLHQNRNNYILAKRCNCILIFFIIHKIRFLKTYNLFGFNLTTGSAEIYKTFATLVGKSILNLTSILNSNGNYITHDEWGKPARP